MADAITRLKVIDSHTGGEPTRVLIDMPELAGTTPAEKLVSMRDQFDHLRRAAVTEPRGSDVLVGAVLLPPADPANQAGVIFFNTAGYLGMCGHGTIGLVATLAHMGKIGPGLRRIETPVGTVEATLHDDGDVSVRNVPSYRLAKDVSLNVEGIGHVTGDIAWGGNWFFLVKEHDQGLNLSNAVALTRYTMQIMEALDTQQITGTDGAKIDHVELFTPGTRGKSDSKNFVLCPGGAYDRSPCGTGTSAKVACLAADGKLQPGAVWRQESITGSVFLASFETADGQVYPTIRGRAYVNAEATLLLNPNDPACYGLDGTPAA